MDNMIMSTSDTSEHLRTVQCATGANLDARIEIHRRFGAGQEPWQHWLFDQIDAPPNCRILELGCGTGRLWQDNADRIPAGWEITLSDFSEGMLEATMQNVGAIGRPFELQSINAESIPYPDDRFDIVLANFMLYHVPNKPKAYLEIARVLKPTGKLIAATNGMTHMREIMELGERFELIDGTEPNYSSFSLENGSEQLSAVFRSVKLLRLEGGLRVTEAQPVIDYLLSMHTRTPSAEAIAGAMAYVEKIIETDGAFNVQKASGLFVASC